MEDKRKRIILLSKDVLGKFYLPIYGNQYWKTPNIDALAEKGTVFNRHYTAAPSSAMSYYSMFTGTYPMDSKMKTYKVLSEEERYSGDTFFDRAERQGYDCHIVWDIKWDTTAKIHSECYGKNTTFHSLIDIRQPTGVHAISGRSVVADKEVEKQTCKKIEECIKSIASLPHATFTWMHLPHVFNGRTGYGADIDLFDWCVGMLREFYSDDCIFITADHGNMNGSHGKLGYGFDVNEEASSIPLITPRIENRKKVDFPTTNIDLFSIIFDGVIPMREFVYSDSAYYAQLHRKIAIIRGNYKYIYSAERKKEELYDVVYDPHETQNLLDRNIHDEDRKITLTLDEMYFYPYWDEANENAKLLREEWKRIWKKPNTIEYIRALYEKYGKIIKRKYMLIKASIAARLAD